MARWVSASDNILMEGKLRLAVMYHLLGAQLGSAWPSLISSFPSVLTITTCLLQFSLDLKAGVACFLGGRKVW